MANYNTQAVVSTAPIKDVPDIVFEILLSLSSGEEEEARTLLDGIEGDKLVASLKEYGILVDREGAEDYTWDEDVTSAARETTFTRYKDGDRANGVYVQWDESLSDGAGPLLQWLLSQLPAEVKFLRVEAANTCSRPLPDGFGGFCMVVTREEVRWLHASAAATRVERAITGEVTSTKNVLAEFGLGERGGAAYLAMFIERNGLDQELRRFLEETVAGDGELMLTAMMVYPDDNFGRRGQPDKIGTIKAVRQLTNLGLKEAKDLVEALPAGLGEIPDENEVIQYMKGAGAQFTRRPRVPRG